ncbi:MULTISPECIES: LppA family lipoprotein [unclassified Saccharopolyspora]|uniref:LppA family lipoprotein n=1 Tax=unclassified Saccharopolyspora TaxID=2646250 RepID=UPI001CD7FD2B|nr:MULTISPECIES: LppA family lipoprotein [unclassified Saccharopolyspora]MCA1189969.1 LppA family lipoprotein [Saccharopolyspora sp. 6T]MCA1229152.1 LppA family lipoprotein [Saccharopolyspora sp. 6M]MCA1280118.1 LppA family lipoprotein [Saccharopolyspora sp. 7B]
MKRLMLLTALVMSLTACGVEPGQESEGSMEDQRAELLSRPSMEEASARYQEMLTRVRDELAVAYPWISWNYVRELHNSGCTGFNEFTTTAESQTLGVWSTEGNIPDPEWPHAEQIVARISAEYGFTPPETVVSRPADHQIVGSDAYGAGYRFGTAKRTVLSGSTGCHLPQAEKDKLQQSG